MRSTRRTSRGMVRGKVSGNQQTLIAVEIIDGDGRPRSVEVVLDTGFTDYLTCLRNPSVNQRCRP